MDMVNENGNSRTSLLFCRGSSGGLDLRVVMFFFCFRSLI